MAATSFTCLKNNIEFASNLYKTLPCDTLIQAYNTDHYDFISATNSLSQFKSHGFSRDYIL
jgi:hypothetical protein